MNKYRCISRSPSQRLKAGLVVVALAQAWQSVEIAKAKENDFEVQASNVADIKVGAKFDGWSRLVLPAGGAVTLIDRTGSTVKTRECVGAYDGPVERCVAASPTGAAKSFGGGTRGGLR